MIVTCSCGAKLKIGDDKLTDAGVRIKCPKCGTPHLVKKPLTAGVAAPVAPGMPWFASPSAEQPAPAVEAKPKPAVAPTAAPAAAFEPGMPWFASPSAEQPAPTVEAKPKPAVAPTAAPAPASGPAMPWFASPREQAPPSPTPVRSTPLVLVAHDSKVVVDMIQGVVSEAGLRVEHAPDGLEALKKASLLKPQVMIVDVGLTGIYGFELCERLKGDPETRGIKIILLSSVYGLTAYKRNPVTLYGADDYIEKHHIPDRLVPKIKELLAGRPSGAQAAPVAPQPAAAPPRPVPAPEPPPPAAVVPASGSQVQKPSLTDTPDVLPKVPVTLDGTRRLTPPSPFATAAPAPAPARKEPPKAAPDRAPAQDESIKLDAAFFEQDEYKAPEKAPVKVAVDPAEVEKARRFARIVVSDIVLYNQEAVAEGLVKGTLFELLQDDISEGRALYDNRVPEAIRASKDYFQEAFDNFIETKKKQR